MKKVFLAVFCVILILSYVASAMAQAADATLTFTEDGDSIFSICRIENMLYLLGANGLYVWLPGQDEAQLVLDLHASAPYQYLQLPPENQEEKAIWQQAVRYLFTDGKELYALQSYSGQIFAWRDGQLVESFVLPKEQFFFSVDEQEQPREMKSLTFFEGKLYLVLGTDDYSQWDKTELFCYDLAQDTMVTLPPVSVQSVFPGSTGKLLLYISPNWEEQEKDASPGLWQYDIASGALEKEILAFDDSDPSGGYAWSKQEECLYFSKDGEVKMLLANGKIETKAYLPIGYISPTDSALVSEEGWYAYAQYNAVLVRDITGKTAKEQTVLRIMGNLDQNVLLQYTAKHPDIAIVALSQNKLNEQSVQQSILSGDQSIDLYMVDTEGAYPDIREKGFAAPMNHNTSLMDQAKLLYPSIQGVIFQGDQLLAYPAYLRVDTWTVNETAWNRIGLGKYPSTMPELFELLDTWKNEYAQEYTDYTLIDLTQGLSGYVSIMVKSYIMQHEKPDDALSFDNPTFREAAEMVLKYRDTLSITEAEVDHVMNLIPLVMTYAQGFGVGSNDGEKNVMLAPPALMQGQSQVVKGNMELFVLNHLSQYPEQALDFVAFYAESVDIETKYSLYPALNEPVRYQDYDTRHAKLVQEINMLEGKVSNALPEEKKSAQSALEDKQAELSSMEKNEWRISQESIDNYRSVVQNLVFSIDSFFSHGGESGGYGALQQVIQRFSDGELTLDQFIMELDRKAKMIYQEGK